MKTDLQWRDGVHFVAKSSHGPEVNIDGPPDIGGRNQGLRPMELMLMGIGGCTAVDVLHILHKSRCIVDSCRTTISAERAETDPRVFEKIHIHFALSGPSLLESKVSRAIELSAEKYCSASILMKRAGVEVTHDWSIEQTSIKAGASSDPSTVLPVPMIGLHHVALTARNYEETRSFYIERMGMAVEWEPDSDNVYLTSGTDNLAIHRAERLDEIRDSSLDHIGFVVSKPEHVDEWFEHFKQSEIEIETSPKTHRDGARSFYALDPDGNKLQVIFHPPLAEAFSVE